MHRMGRSGVARAGCKCDGGHARAAVRAALLAVLLLLCANGEAAALPFQLLESPSAIPIRRGEQEIKLDYATESDPIPTDTLLLHYRFGAASWMELSAAALYARFTEADIERFSEAFAAVKFRLPTTVFKHAVFGYLRHRRALGDPVIVKYQGPLPDVVEVVSRYADGGRDTSLGILLRRPIDRYAYTAGLEYKYAGPRRYGDFSGKAENVYTVYFTPEWHSRGGLLMLALENRYTYWAERGDYYDVIPQVRWEFVKNWVVETGVSFPVVGARTYRYILGFTYQF